MNAKHRWSTRRRSLPCVARMERCAVPRHGLSVGGSPTRQLSLWPVAIRALVGGNETSEASGVKGHLGDSANGQALTRSERRAGLEKGNAEAKSIVY